MTKENAKNLYLEAIRSCEEGKEVWADCRVGDKKAKGYQVSNFGNVRSFWKTGRSGGGKFLCEDWKSLKGRQHKGYKVFDFGRKIMGVRANRLVMDSFYPLEQKLQLCGRVLSEKISEEIWNSADISMKKLIANIYLIVDHIDHVKTNNRIVNLEYTTQKENARRATSFYGGNTRSKKNVEKRKRFAVYDPDKNLFREVDLTRFCRERKLDRRSMQKLIKEEIKSYKGWTRANNCYY